jgi:hypothetical protein
VPEAADIFANYAKSASGPYSGAFAITPADLTDFDSPARAVYCGGSGNIVVVTTAGDQVAIPAVAGNIYIVHVARVRSTGTTATALVGLF